jgi:SAM-dependent methyltransferase
VNANKALWEKGDFTVIAESLRDSGAELIRALQIGPGMKVLDVGCGDGTTAIPAAVAGADVTGVDIASNLVAAGRRRAEALGLTNVRFREGDAQNLEEFSDDSFDFVLSIFGAMFAPNPQEVAKELVRVARPGGTIVMGNWIPGDPTWAAELFRIATAYNPPPEGFVSPLNWGMPAIVTDRFEKAGIPRGNVTCEPRPFPMRHAGPPEEYAMKFIEFFGPTMNAYEAASNANRQDEFKAELVAAARRLNQSGHDDETLLKPNYLQVKVQVP